MKQLIRVIALCLGVSLTAHAIARPGRDMLMSGVGGVLLGVSVVLEDKEQS